MKILLTGASGDIGRRLLPVLIDAGHEVVCVVRDKTRVALARFKPGQVSVIEADLLKEKTLSALPKNIDAAYYLVHSMSMSSGDFSKAEKKSAQNFVKYIDQTQASQ